MWHEITNTGNITWDANETPEITGVLRQIKQDVGPNHSIVYVLETSEGEVDIWGTTVLDQNLPKVSIGTRLKIKYLGEQLNPASNRTYKSFKVWQENKE
jgi:hypothetical protein